MYCLSLHRFPDPYLPHSNDLFQSFSALIHWLGSGQSSCFFTWAKNLDSSESFSMLICRQRFSVHMQEQSLSQPDPSEDPSQLFAQSWNGLGADSSNADDFHLMHSSQCQPGRYAVPQDV